MEIAALHHTKMAEGLAALRAAVSSTVESALGRLPDETFWVEVVGKLGGNSGGWRSGAHGFSGLA
jgi:hypothetical protein